MGWMKRLGCWWVRWWCSGKPLEAETLTWAVRRLFALGDAKVAHFLVHAWASSGCKVEAMKALSAAEGLAAANTIAELACDMREGNLEAVEQLKELLGNDYLEPLVRFLSDPDSKRRVNTVELLEKLRDARVVASLVGAATDTSADVRRAAYGALRELKDAVAVGALVKGLRDPVPDARQAAAYALDKTGDPTAVDSLIAVLEDESAAVVRAAAHSLGEIGDGRAGEALAAALKHDDIQVVLFVTEALARIGDSRAIHGIARLPRCFRGSLSDRHMVWRLDSLFKGARQILKRDRHRVAEVDLVAISQFQDLNCHWRVHTGWIGLGSEQVPVGRDETVVIDVSALRNLAEQEIARRRQADSSSPVVQTRSADYGPVASQSSPVSRAHDVARLAESIGEGRAAARALDLLKDADPQVRAAAVALLQRIGDVRALLPLARLAVEDSSLTDSAVEAFCNVTARYPRGVSVGDLWEVSDLVETYLRRSRMEPVAGEALSRLSALCARELRFRGRR